MRLLQRWRDTRRARAGRRLDDCAWAADLGLTPEEADEHAAQDQLRALTGAREIHTACDRVQGGTAMRAGGRLYWWREQQLYALRPEAAPSGLPAAPPEITADAVEGAIAQSHSTSFIFEMGTRSYYSGIGLATSRLLTGSTPRVTAS